MSPIYRKDAFRSRESSHLVVHAGGVVHSLHPATGDAPDVDLLLALGQPRQTPAVIREIRHLVVVRIAAERLKQNEV